jgi:hypothetical protein
MKKPQKELEELKEQKEKWMELSNVIKFLESKGLEIKECVYNKSRSEFVKGKLFEDKIKENLEEVCKQVNKIMKTEISPTKPDKAIQEIYKQFKSVNLISKACREDGDKKKNVKRLLPYEQLALLFKCNCGKDHDELENPDHQKKLDVDKLFSFEPSFFYVLNVNRGKSKIYFYLILIIIAILMYALMPVWPYQLRVALYWISYVLLCIMIGIYVVKVIVYVFFYTFGYDVLIFPDMDDPKLGFIDSFKRVISVEKRKDKWYFLVLRLILAIITGYIAFCVYRNPKLIDQTQKIIVDAIRDVYHYGEDRFVNNNSTAISLKNKKKYISLEDLDNF